MRKTKRQTKAGIETSSGLYLKMNVRFCRISGVAALGNNITSFYRLSFLYFYTPRHKMTDCTVFIWSMF